MKKSVMRNLVASLSVSGIIISFYFSLIDYCGYFTPSQSCLSSIILPTYFVFSLLISALSFVSLHWLVVANNRALNSCGFSILTILGYIIFVLAANFFLKITEHIRLALATFLNIPVIFLTISICVCFLIFAIWHREKIKNNLFFSLIILSPLYFIFFVNLLFSIDKNPTLFLPKHDANHISKTKIVFFIFDEMDKQIAFDLRPNNLILSELDFYKDSCFFAENCLQPGPITLYSLPALTIGKRVKSSSFKFNDLKLVLENKTVTTWKKEHSFFQKLYHMGYNPTVIGFYHPYSKILKGQLVDCIPDDNISNFIFSKTFLLKNLFHIVSSIFMEQPVIRKFIKGKSSNNSFDTTLAPSLDSFFENAKKMILDPSINFCFIHWPVPHFPAIVSKTFVDETNSIFPYFSNLQVVDVILKKLKTNLQECNLWDDLTLIISSDHWLRENFLKKADPYYLHGLNDVLNKRKNQSLVPCMIKLPGNVSGKKYLPEFDGIFLHELIIEIAAGKVKTYDAIADWLDKKRLAEKDSANNCNDNF